MEKKYLERINKIQEAGSQNRVELYKEVCFAIAEEIKKTDKSQLGFICKKYAEEAILNYKKMKSVNEEYHVYSLSYKCATYADLFEQHKVIY